MAKKSAAEAAKEIIDLLDSGKSASQIKKEHPDLEPGWAYVKRTAKSSRARPAGSGSQVTPTEDLPTGF